MRREFRRARCATGIATSSTEPKPGSPTEALQACCWSLRRPIRTRAGRASARFWSSQDFLGFEWGGMRTRWGSGRRLRWRFCWMIADMQTEIEAARGLLYYAAWQKDAHPTKMGASASKAKLYASEMVNRVVYKAVQAHGAVGYSRETDVERMYRDARVITIYEGTSEVQRMIIARELLGKAS